MDASLDAYPAAVSGAVQIDGKRNPALVGRLRPGLTWTFTQLFPDDRARLWRHHQTV